MVREAAITHAACACTPAHERGYLRPVVLLPGPDAAVPPTPEPLSQSVVIDYHDLTTFEVEAAINSAITLIGDRIRAPIEAAKIRSTTFSFMSRVKTFVSTTPSFLRFGFGGSNHNATGAMGPASPVTARGMPMSLMSPTAGGGDGKENAASVYFERPLEELESEPMGRLHAPAILVQLMQQVRAKGLNNEGLFRIAGNKRRVKSMRQYLDRGEPIPVTLSEEASAHDYADLLKEFLRCLPEPLIGLALTPIYVAISRLQDSLDNAQMVRPRTFTH